MNMHGFMIYIQLCMSSNRVNSIAFSQKMLDCMLTSKSARSSNQDLFTHTFLLSDKIDILKQLRPQGIISFPNLVVWQLYTVDIVNWPMLFDNAWDKTMVHN